MHSAFSIILYKLIIFQAEDGIRDLIDRLVGSEMCIRDSRKRERGRDTGRGRSRLLADSLMWD